MKSSIKKTCNGCRALRVDQYEPMGCHLGFRMSRQGVPLEPCPKPRTVKNFVDLLSSSDFLTRSAESTIMTLFTKEEIQAAIDPSLKPGQIKVDDTIIEVRGVNLDPINDPDDNDPDDTVGKWFDQ